MGLPAPSTADPSRGFRPVEAPPVFGEPAAPVLGVAAPALEEPISPELALVDPELAARLRARLPMPDVDPEPEAPAVSVQEATVHPLRPALVVVDADAGADVADASAASGPPPSTERSDVKRLLTAFAAGAAVAAIVTTGVIAQMGESDTFGVDRGTVPPVTAHAGPAQGQVQPTVPPAKTQGRRPVEAKRPAKARTKPRAAPGPKTKPPAAPAAPAASKTVTANPQSVGPRSKPQTAPPAKTKPATPQKPAVPAAESRRFAWAPVDGAVAYRIEIFRGDEQILLETTKTPAFAVPAAWRHHGHAEALSAGNYRWYVWPVLPDGPASKAAVQARLTIP